MAKELKCPPAFWDGSMSENARAIWLWRATWFRREIPLGTQLVLPQEGQVYRFKGVRLWAYRGNTKRREISYTFESNCILCGAPFDFRTPSGFRALVRTCKEHRRAWRTKQAKPRRQPKPRGPRDAYAAWGKVQLAVFEAYARDMSRDEAGVVAATLDLLKSNPPLKGNVTRAYRQLVKRGAIQVDDNGAALL